MKSWKTTVLLTPSPCPSLSPTPFPSNTVNPGENWSSETRTVREITRLSSSREIRSYRVFEFVIVRIRIQRLPVNFYVWIKEGIAYAVTVFASAFHRRCRTKIKTKLLDSAHFKQDDTSMLLNSQVSFRRPCRKVKKRHICGCDLCPFLKRLKDSLNKLSKVSLRKTNRLREDTAHELSAESSHITLGTWTRCFQTQSLAADPTLRQMSLS